MDRAAMRTIDARPSLRLYAVGWLVCLAGIVFLLIGLLTTITQAPLFAVPFFGVFLYFAGKMALALRKQTGAYLNFGRASLEMQGELPAVGGELKGIVRFAGQAAPAAIEAELVCVLETQSRISRENVRISKDVVLSEKKLLAM